MKKRWCLIRSERMKSTNKTAIKTFQKKILDWYAENKRDLPWRKNRDPYSILVSEIMLQQTQVNRVIPKYEAWFRKFPTINNLAKAKVSDVLALWSGLGYNRRVLNLKKTAEIIVEKYKGKFPQDEKELLELSGIGIYTARALLCFAFDQQIAVVDTNIRKVILTQFSISRHCEEVRRVTSKKEVLLEGSNPIGIQLYDGDCRAHSSLAMTEKEVQDIADHLLPKGKAYEWNQALMDYSSTVLREHKIPIPKQSKFIGSHRYYRGRVIKALIQYQKIPIAKMGKLIKKDYTEAENVWLKKLVGTLADEGFIVIHEGYVTLS